MHRLDAQVHGLGANEPACTPSGDATGISVTLYRTNVHVTVVGGGEWGSGNLDLQCYCSDDNALFV